MECRDCGEPVPEDAQRCPNCGAARAEAAAPDSDASDASAGEPTATPSDRDGGPSVEEGLLGGRGGGDESHATTASVPRSRVYEDPSGTRHVERRLGPDRRLQVADDGTPFFERGTATRALAGAVAAASVLGALYLAFLFPGAPEGAGSVSPLDSPFGLIDAVPFGDFLLALALLWIGARTAVVASRGREYVGIEEE